MNFRWMLTHFLAQFRKQHLERELDDEILAHLELAENEAIAGRAVAGRSTSGGVAQLRRNRTNERSR